MCRIANFRKPYVQSSQFFGSPVCQILVFAYNVRQIVSFWHPCVPSFRFSAALCANFFQILVALSAKFPALGSFEQPCARNEAFCLQSAKVWSSLQQQQEAAEVWSVQQGPQRWNRWLDYIYLYFFISLMVKQMARLLYLYFLFHQCRNIWLNSWLLLFV